MIYDYAVVGGGIVGLSTALALGQKFPGSKVAVLEKESSWAFHQSGRNSGVLHSGLYYKSGSLKAKLTVEGRQAMEDFCREHGLPYELCGKLIVATQAREIPRLENLFNRAAANGVKAQKMSSSEAREREPHVNCQVALFIESTGIVDFKSVCRKMADIIKSLYGGDLYLHTEAKRFLHSDGHHLVETNRGTLRAKYLVNCAGLQSDRVARKCGLRPEARIVPFRGEYFELVPERCHLVRHLIYPVPDPELPFLGVHLTRLVDGHIHAGPNAVLSLKREGYRKTSFHFGDTLETLAYPGFWRMAKTFWRIGIEEGRRSFSRRLFARSLQKLVPDVQANDLVPSESGVRAQCVASDGRLVDDFFLLEGPRSLHVLNAPSPAATASLAIGRFISERIQEG